MKASVSRSGLWISRQSQSPPLSFKHFVSARRHHRFAFATASHSFPRQPEGRPRPPLGTPEPRPPPRPHTCARGPQLLRAEGGGQVAKETGGRQPAVPTASAAESRLRGGGGGRGAGKGRGDEKGEGRRGAQTRPPAAIDGLLLRPRLVCLPRPSPLPGREDGSAR